MARVFTTSFSYQDTIIDAIVTVITKDDDKHVSIRLLNYSDAFVPDGQLSFMGKSGEHLNMMAEKLPEPFLQCLSGALKKHLEPES